VQVELRALILLAPGFSPVTSDADRKGNRLNGFRPGHKP
jgi:hypothetical protein